MKRLNSLLLGAAFVLTACGGKGGDTPGKTSFNLSGEAKTKWDTLCVACHGTSGHGDGPSATALNPKPRSFGDPAWQKQATDEHIAKVIVEGGKAGGLSDLMPPNPDLKSKKAVVDQLVKKVRSFNP